jgi:hypothetical protein
VIPHISAVADAVAGTKPTMTAIAATINTALRNISSTPLTASREHGLPDKDAQQPRRLAFLQITTSRSNEEHSNRGGNRATAASLAGCGTLRQHCRGIIHDDFGDYTPAWYVAAGRRVISPDS